MPQLTRLCRAVGVGLAVAAMTLSVTGVAHAEPAPPNLNLPAIAVPAGNKVFLVGKVAAGVQIYKCTAAGWTFDRLEVTLVGDIGKEIIKHFAGPTWQAKDGSTAKAAVQEPRVTVDPTAIPWLLLKTTSAAAGPGGDRLARTTYIQRVNTGRRRSDERLRRIDGGQGCAGRLHRRLLLLEGDRPRRPLIGRIDLSSGRSRTMLERPFPVTERGEIGPARSRYRT